MWKEVWNLLVRNNWWNSRKNKRKEKCDFSHLSNWMKLPRDWIGWMVEIDCNQTNNRNSTKQMTISTTTELDFLLLSTSEGNVVLSSFNPTILLLSAFFEWLVREQEHLKRENGNEMEKYLLIANQQSSKMTFLHNECCFQWDLECLFKSNQIKSYFPISHIPLNRVSNHFPEFEWVKEDLNNHYHNTIHISFHFNLLFMINVLSKLSWPLMIVLRLSLQSPARTCS